MSLLPDINRKVRFFLPEARCRRSGSAIAFRSVATIAIAGLAAEVSFVATEAEFTPPVIYSKDNREKLVFRVDAKPLGDAVALKVGQPLDITLIAGGAKP